MVCGGQLRHREHALVGDQQKLGHIGVYGPCFVKDPSNTSIQVEDVFFFFYPPLKQEHLYGGTPPPLQSLDEKSSDPIGQYQSGYFPANPRSGT